MEDSSEITILAWPVQPDGNAFSKLTAALSACDGDEEFELVDGDEETRGPILVLSDPDANHGLDAYEPLTEALGENSISYYAFQFEGSEYPAREEYRPAVGEAIERTLAEGDYALAPASVIAAYKARGGPDVDALEEIPRASIGEIVVELLAPPHLPDAVQALR